MLYATLKNKNWGKRDARWNTDYLLSEKGDEKEMKKGDEIASRVEKTLEIITNNPQITINELALALQSTKKGSSRKVGGLKD